jgi:hypothetical protein
MILEEDEDNTRDENTIIRMVKQIATLKAALIKERAAQGTGLMFWNQAPMAFKELYTQKAKEQLAHELPEVNWNE